MSTNPYQLMLSGREGGDVLKAFALMPPNDFAAVAAQLKDEELPWVATYIVTTCNSIGVQQVLLFGGFLELFAAVTESEHRSELMRNMEHDLGISRSQGFRCRDCWRVYGPKLLTEKQTLDQFCRESLKLLAEERTPDAAREEALELARNGDRITIKVAENLRTKHGMTLPVPTSTTSGVVADKPGHWLFSGSTVRIKLVHQEPGELADVPAVIRDLEAAIIELRQMHESTTAA